MKCPKCGTENSGTQKFCGECATPLTSYEEILPPLTKTFETPVEDFTRGTLFADRYEIIEELGRGGMGKVYRAEDTKIKQEIAIKLIRPEISSDKKTIERFSNELKTARMISHRNVGRMFHLGEDDGVHYITMEYVAGQNLKGLIRQSDRLALGTAITIAEQVCEGLAEAHKLGIVHRDLKPSNIMIDKEGLARIMDFGIARSIRGKGLTGTGLVIGTPEYMSPEQVEKKDVDQRSDIYSLGVILYEMVTGKVPFEGETPFSVALKHKSETPTDPKELNAQIPEELNLIILKCLEKELDARYQTVSGLGADLKRIDREMDTGQLNATLTMAVAPPKVRKRPRPGVILSAALFLVLVLVFSISPVREYVIVNLGLRPIPETQYLAILPFTVNTENPQLNQISRGLVETLTNKLTQLESLQESLQIVPYVDVRDITSTQQARKSLGVNLVITGQLVPVLDNVKLMLSLIDTDPPRQLRSRDLEAPQENIHVLYEEAVYAVVEMLAFEIKPEMGPILESKGTDNPDAWVFYLEGLGLLLEYQDEKAVKDESDLDRAIELFNKAIEKDPSYALAYVELGNATWEKWKETKRDVWVDQAKAIYNQALSLDESLPNLHLALGLMHGDSGEDEIAAQYFLRALQFDPSYSTARQQLAFTYEKMGMMDEAEQEYREVITRKPDYWPGYYYFGLFFCYQGRYQEGEEMFLKITALAPDITMGYDLLGYVYQRLGKYDFAIINYEKSLDIQPSNGAYSNLGTIYYFEQANYEKAREMFEKALAINDSDFSIWGNLADSMRLLGEDKRARAAYERAVYLAEQKLKVMQRDPETYSRLARYYAFLGDKKKALMNISRARELAPNNVEVIMSCVKVYELVDERDQALSALAEMINLGGSISELDRNPDMEELRKDSRYQDLITK
jgi:serine/threonine protein kinase/tetratricopeptide (TPR) repeat protein